VRSCESIPVGKCLKLNDEKRFAEQERSGIEADPRAENQQFALPRNGGDFMALKAGDGVAAQHGKTIARRTPKGKTGETP
jgi:hypothetical protein